MASTEDLLKDILEQLKSANQMTASGGSHHNGGASGRGDVKSTEELVNRVFDSTNLYNKNGGLTPENLAKAIESTINRTYWGKNADKRDKKKEDVRQAIRQEGYGDLGVSSINRLANTGKQFKQISQGLTKIAGTGNGAFSKMAGGAAKAFGSVGGAVAKMAGPVGLAVAGVQAADKVFAAISKRINEFRAIRVDNDIKKMAAATAELQGVLSVTATAYKNAAQAGYSAMTTKIKTDKGIAKAAADADLAERKFFDDVWSWVPFYGTYRANETQKIEQENKMIEAVIDQSESSLESWQNLILGFDDGFKSLNKSFMSFARSSGATSGAYMSAMKRNLTASASAVAAIGKTLDDVVKARNAFISASGRNINWSSSTSKKMLSVGTLVGQDNVNQFAAQAELFNISVADSADIMFRMYKDANKLGISQQKLTKDVLSNMKLAQKYSFKDGVEGMIRASKWAETARFNMQSLGSSLEKTIGGGITGIVEQSAKLQVLGGAASMYANPFEMAYEAFNDAEAYAQRQKNSLADVGRMVNGNATFTQFDQVKMRAMAEAYGVSYEDMSNMARQTLKENDIRKQGLSKGLSAESVDAITNNAQYDKKTNKWYVTTIDGGRIDTDKLNSSNVNNIMPVDNRSAEDIAKATLNVDEQMSANVQAITMMMAQSGGYSNYLNYIKETNKTSLEGYTKNMDKVVANQQQLYDRQTSELKKELDKLGTLPNVNQLLKTIDANVAALADNTEGRAEAKREMKDTINRRANNVGGYESYMNMGLSKEMAKKVAVVVKNEDISYNDIESMSVGKEGEYFRDLLEALNKAGVGQNGTTVNDALITKSGRVVRFDNTDDIFAWKNGGAYDSAVRNSMPFPLGITDGFASNSGEGGGASMSHIKMEPININMSGSINLTSGGQSIDILSEMKRNPKLMEEITEMIMVQMGRSISGRELHYDGAIQV